MKKYWLILALTAITTSAQRGGRGDGKAVQPAAHQSGDRERCSREGAVFQSYGCYACHGFNGETGARPFVGRWGNLATEQVFVYVPTRAERT